MMRGPSDDQSAFWRRAICEKSRASGRSLSDEVVDELVAHLADVYDAERAQGASAEAAAATIAQLIARESYGDVSATKRAGMRPSRLLTRAWPPKLATAWSVERRWSGGASRLWMDTRFDVRYALRGMRRQPAFSAAIVLILAIGIASTTAAYAVIRSVILDALPYPASDRLVVLEHGNPPNKSRSFAPADWLDYAAQRGTLSGLAAYTSWPMNMTGSGEPERLRSFIVSGNFFDVIGVPPALGRVTTLRDDTPSAPAVVVLSDGFWRRRFGASPSVIGTEIRLNGKPATVVGVMPPEFALPKSTVDLWMPMGLSPQTLADRSGEWLSVIGRLDAGVTIEAARTELTLTATRLATAFPRPNRDTRIVLRSLADEIVGGARRALWLGALAALFVLLAGTANAANLLLARATVRHDELAIRSALGAEPLRLARQLLIESSVLSCFGGACGIALSWVFVGAFGVLAEGLVPRANHIEIGGSAVAAAIAASIVCASVVGGAGAWLLARSRSIHWSRHESPQRVVRPARLQGTLLAAQVAFALMLVAGATAVVQSYSATVRIDPGFDASDTMTMQLTLPRGAYADSAAQIRFVERALEAVGGLPSVVSTGVVSDLPFVGNATHFSVIRQGEASTSGRMTTVRVADAGFFATLRVPLVAGRFFDGDDRRGHETVAVLNRSAAERYGVHAAVGQRLQIPGDEWRTVVGVAGDIKHAGLHGDEGAVMYIPYAQKSFAFLNWFGIVVRTRGPLPSEASLKGAIGSVDPNQPIEAVRSMDEYLSRERAPYRFSTLVVGSLAGAALILALTGVYGLTAFVVGGRSRELALRLALGASAVAIVTTVFRQVASMLLLGTTAGLVGSVLTMRLLTTIVAESARGSALSAAAAGAIFIGLSAGIAALGPALRGAWLDPNSALRSE